MQPAGLPLLPPSRPGPFCMPHGSAGRTGRDGGKLVATSWLGHTTGFGCGQPTSAWGAAVRSLWRGARARSVKDNGFWCIERLLPSPAPVWPWLHSRSESPRTGHVRPWAGSSAQSRQRLEWPTRDSSWSRALRWGPQVTCRDQRGAVQETWPWGHRTPSKGPLLLSHRDVDAAGERGRGTKGSPSVHGHWPSP